MITHKCPPDGEGVLPCCGKTMFEVPQDDRVTWNDESVDCGKASLEKRVVDLEARVKELERLLAGLNGSPLVANNACLATVLYGALPTTLAAGDDPLIARKEGT